jgi:hypothetical protein
MTNAEKYQEVFGFPPDKGSCPAEDCHVCPINNCSEDFGRESTFEWWDEEYKGVTNG